MSSRWMRTLTKITMVVGIIQVFALGHGGARTAAISRESAVSDWTSRSVVFSGVTAADEQQLGEDSPRFRNQRRLQRASAAVKSKDQSSSIGVPTSFTRAVQIFANPSASKKNPVGVLDRDWSTSLTNGGKVGIGMFPAKFTFDVNATASCANDFVVFNTSLVGSATQPSIIAYNQLYTGTSPAGICAGAGPSVLWSYRIGAATGTVGTSTILSLDGTKVMFVENRTTGGAFLHILRWKSGEGSLSLPATPTNSGSAWSSCIGTNSCLITIALSGTPQVTRSSPFYDYNNDALYVGDNAGKLHKFTPVLSGSPADISTNGWPLTVNSGVILASPVRDEVNDQIFVGDASGRISRIINVASGTVSVGSVVNQTGSIVDAPVVDSFAGKVYVFNGSDTANRGSVYQDTTSALGSEVKVDVGDNSTTTPIHPGAFNQAYFSGSGTAYLYVCGKLGSNDPVLHRIGFNGSGTLNGSTGGSLTLVKDAGSNGNTECSPITSFYNTTTATDRLFLSIGQDGNFSGCSGACVMAFDITGTGMPTAPAAVFVTPAGVSNGASTSGIVIDNVSSSAQASSIYFSYIANSTCNGVSTSGCAVKLTQSGLN